jgi:hypothetical protein
MEATNAARPDFPAMAAFQYKSMVDLPLPQAVLPLGKTLNVNATTLAKIVFKRRLSRV